MKIKVTANGDYPINGVFSQNANRIIILMPAVVTGTVVLGYEDAVGTFVPMENGFTAGAVAAGEQYAIDHGLGPYLIFKVTDYTAAFQIGLVSQK